MSSVAGRGFCCPGKIENLLLRELNLTFLKKEAYPPPPSLLRSYKCRKSNPRSNLKVETKKSFKNLLQKG